MLYFISRAGALSIRRPERTLTVFRQLSMLTWAALNYVKFIIRMSVGVQCVRYTLRCVNAFCRCKLVTSVSYALDCSKQHVLLIKTVCAAQAREQLLINLLLARWFFFVRAQPKGISITHLSSGGGLPRFCFSDDDDDDAGCTEIVGRFSN